MTKTLLLAIAIGTIASTAHAQGRTKIKTEDYREPEITEVAESTKMEDAREKFIVGLKAGANYSGVYQATGSEFMPKGKFGLAAGAFVGIPIIKLLGIQPEVLYSQKGFSATGKVSGAQYDITRTTSYIDVPVFLAVKPSKYYTFLVGPQYSYLLQQKDVFTYPVVGVAPLRAAMNGNIRKDMLAIAAGMDISSTHMVLSLRGGIDLRHNTEDGTTTTPRYKNKWVQLTIGYRF